MTMSSRYQVHATRAEAQAAADSEWTVYAARVRAARGLLPGASFDTRAGREVQPPVTTRCAEVSAIAGSFLVEIDDQISTDNGATTVDRASLSRPIQDALDARDAAQSIP